MKLKVIDYSNIFYIQEWRNDCLEALRTPFLITDIMQEKFYQDVINNRNSNSRYFGIHTNENKFIGMCGLENIEWENGRAEISIILNPEVSGKGYGKEAIKLLLDEGFKKLRLNTIYGECYTCNKAVGFWEKIIQEYNADVKYIPKTKFYNGEFYDSLYFTISKEDYNVANMS